jgi:hypothetical protein
MLLGVCCGVLGAKYMMKLMERARFYAAVFAKSYIKTELWGLAVVTFVVLVVHFGLTYRNYVALSRD